MFMFINFYFPELRSEKEISRKMEKTWTKIEKMNSSLQV